VAAIFGRAGLCSSCLSITSLGRDRPRRLILPMTALRVTPISRICPKGLMPPTLYPDIRSASAGFIIFADLPPNAAASFFIER
jgi:hypothetical protein